jgi:hypothetical protein
VGAPGRRAGHTPAGEDVHCQTIPGKAAALLVGRTVTFSGTLTEAERKDGQVLVSLDCNAVE